MMSVCDPQRSLPNLTLSWITPGTVVNDIHWCCTYNAYTHTTILIRYHPEMLELIQQLKDKVENREKPKRDAKKATGMYISSSCYPGVVNDRQFILKYTHSSIQHIIIILCNRNVFTNFLPCSHAINPNNETCLVTCAVSLTCATWLMYAQFLL